MVNDDRNLIYECKPAFTTTKYSRLVPRLAFAAYTMNDMHETYKMSGVST